jgi:hypothetical protein
LAVEREEKTALKYSIGHFEGSYEKKNGLLLIMTYGEKKYSVSSSGNLGR